MTTDRTQGSDQENTPTPPRQGAVTSGTGLARAGARGAVIAAATLTSGLVLWTGRSPVRAAVGSELGEADNHLWMFARAARGPGGGEGAWANLPEGIPVPLMDPANLPVYLLGQLLDPVVGWNLLALWSVLLAGAGGYALARVLGASRAGAIVGLCAAAGAPFLAGVVDFGITESWGLGWLGLHAAALLRFGDSGRGRDAALAGLCLAATALQGWYMATFALAVEPLLVAGCLRRGGARRLVGVAGQGLFALLVTLPALQAFLAARSVWSGRWRPPPEAPPMPRPDWATLPIGGADLLTFVRPATASVDPSKATYLGLLVLALAGAALVFRTRRALLPWACAAVALLLALGPWPTAGGRALGPPGPALALLHLFEPLQGLSHWQRAVGAAVPFLAAAAALGADALLARLPRPQLLGLILGLLVVGEGLLLSPTAWPRRSIVAELPAGLSSLATEARALPPELPRGVVQLPFDNHREMFSTLPARRYNRWQVHHGLPVSESYETVDAVLARSMMVAGWQRATGQRPTLPPEQRPPRDALSAPVLDDPGAVASETARLRSWGYRWVVLHRALAPAPDAAEAAVTSALGPGRRVGDDVLWTLPDPARPDTPEAP